MFEKASRMKLRFQTAVGILATEDLWNLKLTQLNDLAKSLNKQIKEAEEESFIKEPSTANKELSLKFNIVKHIIGVLLEEKKAKEQAKEKKERRELLKSLLHKKQTEELEGMSVEDIQKELDKL